MVLHLNAGKDTTVYIKKIKNGQSFKIDRFCLRDCCRTCFCCWCRVRRNDKWSYLAKRKNFVHKSDLAPIAFSFGTRSQKQQKTFLKNLHFLEGLFPFPVNIYYRTKKICRKLYLRRIAANIIFDRFFLSYNIYLPESEKVLLKNANFLKKFSFISLTWHQW